MSLNVCMFIGNLTRDPEMKYTASGTAIASFGIALNRKYTSNGEKREEVTFLDLTAFGQTAELIEQYLQKGSQAHFTCRANLDTWDDKTTGQKRSKVGFIVEQLTFVGSKRKEESDEDGPPQRQERSQGRSGHRQAPERRPPPPPARKPTPNDPDLDDPEEDDIPF